MNQNTILFRRGDGHNKTSDSLDFAPSPTLYIYNIITWKPVGRGGVEEVKAII